MTQCSVMHDNKAASGRQAAAITLTKMNGQFLNKTCEQYLIICSPGVRFVRQLKAVVPDTHSNMQEVNHVYLNVR
jgi:hypothetical protein